MHNSFYQRVGRLSICRDGVDTQHLCPASVSINPYCEQEAGFLLKASLIVCGVLTSP